MKNIILTLTGVLWLFSPSVIAGAGHESGGCGSAIPCTPTNGNPYSQGPIRYGAPAKSNSGNNGKGHKNSQSGRGGPNNQKISGAYGGIPTGPQLQHRTTKRDVRQLFTRQPEFAFIDPRGSIGGGADPFGVDMDAEGELQTGQSQIQGQRYH